MRKLAIYSVVFAVFAMITAVGMNTFAAAGTSTYFGTRSGPTARNCAELFNKIDLNGDGTVSLSEYRQAYDAGFIAGARPSPSGGVAFIDFDRLDMNGNGFLTEEEYCSQTQAPERRVPGRRAY